MAPRFLVGILLSLVSASAFSRVDNFLLLDERGTARELYYHGDAPAIVLASHKDKNNQRHQPTQGPETDTGPTPRRLSPQNHVGSRPGKPRNRNSCEV